MAGSGASVRAGCHAGQNGQGEEENGQTEHGDHFMGWSGWREEGAACCPEMASLSIRVWAMAL